MLPLKVDNDNIYAILCYNQYLPSYDSYNINILPSSIVDTGKQKRWYLYEGVTNTTKTPISHDPQNEFIILKKYNFAATKEY